MRIALSMAFVFCSQIASAASPFILFEEINKVSQLGGGDVGIRGLITYNGGADGMNSKLAEAGHPQVLKRLNASVLLKPPVTADGKAALFTVNVLNNCYKSAMVAMTNKKEFKFCINANDGSSVKTIYKQDAPDSSVSKINVVIEFIAPAGPGSTSFNCPVVPITASCE